MDFVVFGDDYGTHPSTTQHLVNHLPSADRVLWIDSIGMRSPEPSWSDVRRLASRLRQRPHHSMAKSRPLRVLRPRLLPFHRDIYARACNRRLLGRQIRRALADLGFGREFTVLTANPVAAFYLEALDAQQVGYLRLDAYESLAGVDAELVRDAEQAMYAASDVVLAPSTRLHDPRARRFIHLPQGVDTAHFHRVSLTPPRRKVLGFFGLISSWVDLDLVRSVAERLPDWTLMMAGRLAVNPPQMPSNVRFLGPVPYEDLPSLMRNWDAAWIPFRLDDLTVAVNPLKLREYLAAGLPTLSTPLPECSALGSIVDMVTSADEAVGVLKRILITDTEAHRKHRRLRVQGDGWGRRADVLRNALVAS